LLVSVFVSGSSFILLPSWILLPTRIIISWDAGVFLFLALTWIVIRDASTEKMWRSAQKEDENRLTILTLVVGAACASLLAIAFMLKNDSNIPQWLLILHVILAIATIVISWSLVHVMFALHYAHLYYRHPEENFEREETDKLDFPNEKKPDYWDFFYFSFVIGMTCQVSDVQIASRPLRRLALVHGILTFFFNTVIVALSINLLAGLI
jgi:uncharacterized membrane protein